MGIIVKSNLSFNNPRTSQIGDFFSYFCPPKKPKMNLTKEQKAIINSSGNIKINAVAGSGKTTTILEYAKARPKNSRILYLAFNKSVRLEASDKFSKNNLDNVTVETAHSLAYKHVVFNYNYRVRNQDYKTNEIVELLKLQGNSEKHFEFVIANHILKFVAYFCNSDKRKVQELNYLDIVFDEKAKKIAKSFYAQIEMYTRLFLAKMDKGEIEIMHDFYLKKFQLENPKLAFDYILFDEAQDASPAMLDVFLNQKATKVIVGDTHQQIYGWRHAVNSLEKAKFKTFNLSTSFRFNQDIANLAMGILDYKTHFDHPETISISGNGTNTEFNSKAIIARTNLGLLLKAIEYVTEKKNVNEIYFEGNINSYTYADEGASLYDVLNLQNKNRDMIRDKLIREMKTMKELETYIESTDDSQLGMMVEIVKEYGNKIPGILKSIKEKHVSNEDKHKARIIFSTVHRCKGMEYDTVQIVNDFMTEDRIIKLKHSDEDINIARMNEEINLLYVAVTRTKNTLNIPEKLVPKGFPISNNIHLIKELPEKAVPKKYTFPKKETPNYAEKSKETNKDAYQPWTKELDEELTILWMEGINPKDLAKHFGRTKGAISSRMKKLELFD